MERINSATAASSVCPENIAMSPPTLLIGISGASGSGKSFLARALLAQLEQQVGATHSICEDAYYRAQDEICFDERTQVNYDHPDAIEHDLLEKHLRTIAAGDPVDIPVYDYARHTRSETSRHIAPARIVMVEGILIFHSAPLRERFDLKVFVHTDLETCLSRRIIRDKKERGRTAESVIAQFESSVRPMFHRFVEPAIPHADLVVSGADDISESANAVATRIGTLLASKGQGLFNTE